MYFGKNYVKFSYVMLDTNNALVQHSPIFSIVMLSNKIRNPSSMHKLFDMCITAYGGEVQTR